MHCRFAMLRLMHPGVPGFHAHLTTPRARHSLLIDTRNAKSLHGCQHDQWPFLRLRSQQRGAVVICSPAYTQNAGACIRDGKRAGIELCRRSSIRIFAGCGVRHELLNKWSAPAQSPKAQQLQAMQTISPRGRTSFSTQVCCCRCRKHA